jgi:hypothetical protein
LRAEIELRAYFKYCERGCAAGCDVDDWLAAEQEILTERAAVPPAPATEMSDSHRTAQRKGKAELSGCGGTRRGRKDFHEAAGGGADVWCAIWDSLGTAFDVLRSREVVGRPASSEDACGIFGRAW